MKSNIHIGYAVIPDDLLFSLDKLTISQKQYFESNITHASDKRKRQFYASRLLLNQLSDHHFSPLKLTAVEPLSRPYQLLSNNNQTHNFNISHSHNWVCVAIADANINEAIGVDIQTLKLGWPPEKARFFCSKTQLKKGYESELPDHYFTQLWSNKEAYFKATQQRFTHKDFENDDYLTKRQLSTLNTPVFMSLYCAYTAHVVYQQWSLSDNHAYYLTT